MPTVNLNKKRVLMYLKGKVNDKILREKIPMLGTGLEDITKDEIIVEIFPNRSDMLSEEGFARALNGFLGFEIGLKEYKVKKDKKYKAVIDSSVKEVREHAVAVVVKNIKMTSDFLKGLMQIQEKLHITHSRNRKNASIGVYDLDVINFPINYTAVGSDFVFVPLEGEGEMSIREILWRHPKGKDYAHLVPGPKYPLWIDSQQQVLSFPPIINSEETRVTHNTKNLLVDVTGLDRKAVVQALNILATSLADAGGELYYVDMHGKLTPDLKPHKMNLNVDYVNKLLGLNLTPKQVKKYLERMRYDVQGNSNKLKVLVPSYRTDILHPIDLVEDVAIAYGYDNFKEEIPNVSTIGEEDPKIILQRKVSEVCIGLSLLECLSYHLTNKNTLFEKMNTKEIPVVTASNAVNVEYDTLRTTLLPGLMKILSENTRYEYPQKLFEIGKVIEPDSKNSIKVREDLHLSVVIANKDANFTEIKAVLDAIFRAIGVSYKLKEKNYDSYTPGRTADIIFNNQVIGIIGEINPQVITNFNIEVPVVGFEINLEPVFKNVY